MKHKIIRITTVPISLKILLKDQLKFMNNDFEVVAVSSDGKDLKKIAEEDRIKTIAVNMTRRITPVKDLISLIKMIIVLMNEKPSIVHTHTPKAGIIGMLAAWIARIPIRLHTVAGLPLMETTGIKYKILAIVEKITYFCATRIYPNSHGLEEYILDNHFTRKEKVKVLANGSTNGIDTEHFSRTSKVLSLSSVLREKYKIEEKHFVFIYVGRLVGDKGINELVKAFDLLSRSKKQVKLLLVGPLEEELDPISKETEKIMLDNEQIITVGYQDDVRPFFAISNCLAFPSYREGFPNVVMQAGAMGLPSIVSDINGCKEIIEHSDNGLIILPKDSKSLYNAMLKICTNVDLYKETSKVARARIIEKYEQKFVWKAIKDEYVMQLNR